MLSFNEKQRTFSYWRTFGKYSQNVKIQRSKLWWTCFQRTDWCFSLILGITLIYKITIFSGVGVPTLNYYTSANNRNAKTEYWAEEVTSFGTYLIYCCLLSFAVRVLQTSCCSLISDDVVIGIAVVPVVYLVYCVYCNYSGWLTVARLACWLWSHVCAVWLICFKIVFQVYLLCSTYTQARYEI